jgi:uncharacterized protein YdhG (YjbR/CyaY superfamily)
MAKTDYKSVDEYLASQPQAVRGVLKSVRGAIRKGLPGAEEVISYQIPAYKLHGKVVIYFAGWREHFSIYPATKPLVTAFKKELKPYEVNDKGTIRFPLAEPAPVKLIASLAKFRASEVAGRQKASSLKQRSTSATRSDRRSRGTRAV